MRRSVLAALASYNALSAAAAQASTFDEPRQPGMGRTHANGSKPVSGGGARERERRRIALERANAKAMEKSND